MTAQHSTAAEEGEAAWQPGSHNGQKFYNKLFFGTPCIDQDVVNYLFTIFYSS